MPRFFFEQPLVPKKSHSTRAYMIIVSSNDCRCVIDTVLDCEAGIVHVKLIYLVSEVTLISGDVFYIHYS
jgi:hypothetical protein